MALHPTQIYESAAALVIFIALFYMRRGERFKGKLIWYYLFFYSVARFIIEFYRDDPRGSAIFESLSIAQTIGIPLALLSLYLLLRKRPPTS
ncbi:MAG: prolipoprotein diacylglyceryl transferase [Deltaproteobacteria bacterium]|nr:prolipoprotein diacylglyceryl transferase [Deltaproteobacteria bacterium]